MANKLNKYERINFVRQQELNTEENILIKHNEDINNFNWFINQYDSFSLRTFKDDEEIKNTPHYPVITKPELFAITKELQQNKYNLILATLIDPKDCLFAGAVWKKDREMIIEIALGPGTVRRVTHSPYQIDKTYSISRHKLTGDKLVDICVNEFNKIRYNNVIVEFSYYNIQVGWKKEQFICWEITNDGTNKSGL